MSHMIRYLATSICKLEMKPFIVYVHFQDHLVLASAKDAKRYHTSGRRIIISSLIKYKSEIRLVVYCVQHVQRCLLLTEIF